MSLPPSSPRLPSPPPPAENQIGAKSPSMGPNANRQAQQIEQTQIDAAAKRRIHPGTKSADMAAGPPLVPLNELDSAFQLQEHLAALHYYHTAGNTTPITRETAKLLDAPPPTIDRTLWLYELCRFLIKQCNSLIVGFLFDSPPCSAATCPEMRASEWQFLCAVHDAPKSCCAIDYCCHTLDWAANVVTNPKIFPSRFVALPDGHDRGTALKNLVNVFRRLHRIFAHAWFQHRGVFWSVESQTGLYVFFKTVCDLYDLLPAENYKLPPEAEGLETSTATGAGAAAGGAGEDGAGQLQQAPLIVTGIARPPSQELEPDDDNFQAVGRTNTRRHIRSSPSTGNAVATVPEVDEDDSTGVTSRLRDMHISEGKPEAEPETADVPVIVMEDVDTHPPTRRMSPQTSAEEVEPDPESESVPLAQLLAEEPPSEQPQPQPQPEVAEAAENVPEEPRSASEEGSAEEPAAGGEEVTEPVAEPVAEESEAADAIAKEEPSSEEVGDLTVIASEEEPAADDGTKADDEKEAPAASSPGGAEPQEEETSTSPAEETTTEAQPPEGVKEAKPEDPKDAAETEEKKSE